MPVSPVPPGFHTVTPQLTIKGAKKAIELYKQAFGAEVIMLMETPSGGVAHAELRIGNSVIFLNDEGPQGFSKSPETAGTSTGGLQLYVEDCDAMFERAVAAGAKVNMPPTDWFWGDRNAHIVDPFGHLWGIGTRKEELTEAEINSRAQEFWKKMAAGK